MNALADGHAIAKPDILTDGNRSSDADRLGSIYEVMPIRIADIAASGQHSTVPNGDLAGGIDTHAWTDQHVIAQVDVSLMVTKLPSAKRYSSVAGGHEMQISARLDVSPVQIDIPGLEHHEVGTEGSKVWRNEMIGIPHFEEMNQALDIVGAVISYHEATIASGGNTVMDAMELLTKRVSSPRLSGEVPRAVIEAMMLAASRAPDHAQLAPYRFILVEGQSRARLGEVFVEAKHRAGETLDEAASEKLKQKPLRAPQILIGVASIHEHPKVPEQEQIITAGIALQGCLQVAYAQGFGGMWRTGAMAYDPYVAQQLGLEPSERIVGFLYLGAVEGSLKIPRAVDIEGMMTHW